MKFVEEHKNQNKKPYVPHAINETFCKRVYEQVAKVPKGFVCTYGKIAELAGYPGAAREVGRAMSLVLPEQTLNPHRIVNAKGTLAPYDVFGGEVVQRKLLEGEGVTFKANGNIDMKKCLWPPENEALQDSNNEQLSLM